MVPPDNHSSTANSFEDSDTHVHPRPQTRRDLWTSLNGVWEFAFDPEGKWTDPKSVEWSTKINVPFSPETPASGINDRGYYSVVWYRKTIEQPKMRPGERVFLHFGAVDYSARVWVNNKKVCSHKGGYAPFRADITDVLTGKGPQEIIVRSLASSEVSLIRQIPTECGAILIPNPPSISCTLTGNFSRWCARCRCWPDSAIRNLPTHTWKQTGCCLRIELQKRR